MELKEAKEILNKNGFLLENNVTGLDDSDKLIYLYLSLKNEGYDVSDSTDLVVREKTFKLKIKKQIEIEKLGLTVNVSSIVISEDGCEITAILGGEKHSFVTIPLDSAVFNLDKLNRLIPNNMRSFINVDIHNAIYSYLSKNN